MREKLAKYCACNKCDTKDQCFDSDDDLCNMAELAMRDMRIKEGRAKRERQ